MDRSEMLDYIDFIGVYKEIRDEILSIFNTIEEYKKHYFGNYKGDLTWLNDLWYFLHIEDNNLESLVLDYNYLMNFSLEDDEIVLKFDNLDNEDNIDCYIIGIDLRDNYFNKFIIE